VALCGLVALRGMLRAAAHLEQERVRAIVWLHVAPHVPVEEGRGGEVVA